MDITYFILFSVLYIMIIHLAVAWKDQFNLFLMIGFFILGGVIGLILKSYEVGFVLALILSLVFF